MRAPVLEVKGLRKVYSTDFSQDHPDGSFVAVAVADGSFALAPGGSLAIVGESGSGKTTSARMIAGLEAPTAGEILVHGTPQAAGRLSARARRARGRLVQLVFQDPYLSLDPRQ